MICAYVGENISKSGRSAFESGIKGLPLTSFLFLITALVFAYSASAVTVSGEVYDVRSGLPIEGAALECYDSRAVSGEDGSFTLDEILPGKRLFRATLDGYAVYETGELNVTDLEEGEIWIYVPMLPLDRETPGENEDYLRFFKREAGVIEKEAVSWYELPITVGFEEGDVSRADFEIIVNKMDGILGGNTFSQGDTNEADIVFVSGGAENETVEDSSGVLLLSGEIDEQISQIYAGLMLALLNGKNEIDELDVEKRWRKVDEEIMDFASAAGIISLLGPDFDYDSYKYDIDDGNGILFSFAAGPGKYTKTGWSDPKGGDYYLPYNVVMMALGGGAGIRIFDIVGYVEYLRISTIGTGEGEEHDGLTTKEYTHSFDAYGGGVGYEFPVKYGYLSLRPAVGWQKIKIEGKYEAEDPDDNAIVRKVEKREDISGPYGGLRISLFTPWAKMGGYVEYKYIRAGGFVHSIDVGLGQAQWRGFGVYLLWRQYWNDSLSYGIIGMGMNGEVGI